MKKSFPLVTILFSLIFFGFKNSKTIPIDVLTAIDNKQLVLIPVSNGEFMGESVTLNFENLTNKNLEIFIEAGTILPPIDDKEQTLIISNDLLVTLESKEQKSKSIQAYCTELNDLCPKIDSKFGISQSSDSSLVKLIKLIKQHKVSDIDFIQQSIWCLTDSNSVSSLYSENTASTEPIINYICKTTNQKKDWYMVRKGTEIGEDRQIINSSTEVQGLIEFTSNGNTSLKGYVLNSIGDVIFEYPKPMTFPKGEIAFNFKLVVKGWRKDTYTVRYESEGKELLSKGFTI